MSETSQVDMTQARDMYRIFNIIVLGAAVGSTGVLILMAFFLL